MQDDKNVKKKGFLKGMRAELKKVIWPTGKQTVRSTFVTIAFVLLISLVLIVLNLVFGKLNEVWISSITKDNVVMGEHINGAVSGETNSGEAVSEENISGEAENVVISGEVISGE